MYDERKAAQMAAFFVDRQGGRSSILKLMKLLYLADRESLKQYGHPISYDRMVSMPHGPVLSQTYEHICGIAEDAVPGGWQHWISDRARREVSVRKKNVAREMLDKLSDADVDVLEQVWRKFGHMTPFQLRNYTHRHCPEWRDPDGSSSPIPFSEVLKAVGKTSEQAHAIEEQLKAEDYVDRLFARL